jgi:hypothetical protein
LIATTFGSSAAQRELDHRFERLVRMVEQNVLLPDRGQDVGCIAQAVSNGHELIERGSSMSTWSASDDNRAH